MSDIVQVNKRKMIASAFIMDGVEFVVATFNESGLRHICCDLLDTGDPDKSNLRAVEIRAWKKARKP